MHRPPVLCASPSLHQATHSLPCPPLHASSLPLLCLLHGTTILTAPKVTLVSACLPRTKALLGMSCLLRHSRPCVEAFSDAQGPTHLADLTRQVASSRCRGAVGTSGGSQGPSGVAGGDSEGGEAGPGSLSAASESQRGGDGEQDGEELRQLRKCLQLMAYLVGEVRALCTRVKPLLDQSGRVAMHPGGE